MQSARFLSGLLNKDVVARYAEKEFSTGGKTYVPGTLIITRADNRKNPDFDKIVQEVSARFDYPLTPAESGFVTSGPDFGSDYVRLIDKSRHPLTIIKFVLAALVGFMLAWYAAQGIGGGMHLLAATTLILFITPDVVRRRASELESRRPALYKKYCSRLGLGLRRKDDHATH